MPSPHLAISPAQRRARRHSVPIPLPHEAGPYYFDEAVKTYAMLTGLPSIAAGDRILKTTFTALGKWGWEARAKHAHRALIRWDEQAERAAGQQLFFGFSRLMATAVLQNFAEDEIYTIEAASLYLLTRHHVWTEAAIEFLSDHPAKWQRWLRGNSEAQKALDLCDPFGRLPDWIHP